MTRLLDDPALRQPMPTHLDLPCEDGEVHNFFEHPQSQLLSETIEPVLRRLRPDGQFLIGRDCGIYFKYVAEDPLQGCRAPDWFCVLGVPPLLDGQLRRSYVLWQEVTAPLVILEYASGDGTEERDRTPYTGKFWLYEQAIRAPFYGVFEPATDKFELFHLVDGAYRAVPANDRGHFPVAPLGAELGVWQGTLENAESTWVRWWDDHGALLPTAAERSERLAARLRELGVNAEEI